jgi:hypothetical protein
MLLAQAVGLLAAAGDTATPATPAQPSPSGTEHDSAPVPPGPAILRAPPARSPQMENVAPWAADPVLISGASA